MITAFKINRCANLDTITLEKALNFMYPNDRVKDSKFLGITNGGKFCYNIVYFDENSGEDANTKLFVDLDFNDELYAEY